MEELFGRVKQGFWTIIGLNFKWKHEHKQWRRGKQSEENSCSLLSHFWSTSRFFACYIPFESLGSQESKASNRVWFGAEMRKIWPLEGNCIMSNDQFHKVNFTLRKFRKEIFFMVRNFAILHHEDPPCENFASGFRHLAKFLWIPCFETLLMLFHCRFSKIFCLIFSFVNTYFTLVINQWIGCFCNSSCLFIVKVRFHMLIMEWTSYIK